MARYHVARLEELKPDIRRIVHLPDGRQIAVLRAGGEVYAYENRCLHMGGPVGEGRVFGRIEAQLDDDKRLECENVSAEHLQLVCPWHSWAYDLRTGQFAGDPGLKLQRFETIVEDEDVYLVVD